MNKHILVPYQVTALGKVIEDGQCCALCYARGKELRNPCSMLILPPSSVLASILKERESQDAQWGGPSHDDQHASTDWIHYIWQQFDKYAQQKCHGPVYHARERLIKITALCVAWLESESRKEQR